MILRRRKLLLTGLFAVAILLAGNAAVTALGIKYWRPMAHLWRLNVYAYQRFEAEADVLLLGSSQIQYGISPTEVERGLAESSVDRSVYNLGWASGDTLRSAIVLGDVTRSNGCPSLIVLEVSPVLLNGSTDQTPFLVSYAGFSNLPLLGSALLSLPTFDAYLTGSLSGVVGLYYDRFGPPPGEAVRSILQRRGGRWEVDGSAEYIRMTQEGARRYGRGARRRVLRSYLRDFTLDGAPARGLEATVGIASECGARLVLVRIPDLVPTNSAAMLAIEDAFQGYIEAFSERTGIPYRDISLEDAGLVPEHYQDFNHLNYEGALVLSRYLTREILLPALTSS